MSSFVGIILPDIVQVSDPLTSANLFTPRAYYTGEQLADTPSFLSGSLARNHPSPHANAFHGAPVRDFGDDWYFRVHTIPTQIDLGNLVSTQSRTVSVWNAFLSPLPYTQLVTAGFDGLALTPPAGVTPPTTLRELQVISYGLSVSLSGPPTIAASMRFTIGGANFTVPITGRRVVLMPFPPNWATPVEETLSYRSTVTRAWSGAEQRRSLRESPRRRLGYTALLTGGDAQRLDNLMHGWQGRLFAVPLWAEASALADPAQAGEMTLRFPSANRTFAVGGLVALWADSGRHEVHEIVALTGSEATIRAPLARTWAAGSRVYPAMVASVASEVGASRLTESVAEAALTFDGEPSSTPYPVPKGSAAATYQGGELLLHYVNWAEGVEVVWSSDKLTVDEGSGQFRQVQRSGRATPSKSHNWTLRNPAAVWQYRQWLQRREGRTQPFYAPTGYVDFTLSADAGATDLAVDVADNGYDIFSPASPLRRDLAIQLTDGTTILRRITAAAPNPDGTLRLQLASALGAPVARSAVRRVSLLGFYRLAADDVTLAWVAEGVAQVRAGFVATLTP